MKIKTDLSVKIGKITLRNPVMNASGALTYNERLKDIINYNKLGAYVTKTQFPEPSDGFKSPRIVEIPAGIINCIGGQGRGIDGFIKYEWPYLEKLNTHVIISIASRDLNVWKELGEKINKLKNVAAIEIQLSCPHQYRKWGGLAISTNEELTFKAINNVRKTTNLTLIAKLSPNVSDIQPIAKAAEEAGADALSMINTVAGLAIDIENQKPALGNTFGGISGPCIKPIGIFNVWQASLVVNIPIIGIGGITNYRDALEYIMAGASAVGVGTYSFREPQTMECIVEDLKKYMIKNEVKNIASLVGIAKRK